MINLIDDVLLETVEREDTDVVVRLVELGRKQGFISIDDIIDFFPDVEGNSNLLEEAFTVLLGAGIPFIEDQDSQDSKEPDEETFKAWKMEEEKNSYKSLSGEDHLAHIDADDLVGLYLREAASIPLLTAQEEKQLAQHIEAGRFAQEHLAQFDVGMSPNKHQELCRAIQEGRAALEHLLTANSRLVVSIARKYVNRGLPFLDLIQEGNIGLMRAAMKFEYQRGYKFSTYATWWIRQAITRSIANHSRTIRLPAHMGDKITRLMRAQNTLKQCLGRAPSNEELAEAMEMSPKKVELLIQYTKYPLSLETPINFEEDSVLGDLVEDDETPDPEESATSNLFSEQLRETLEERLPPREARVLKMRYGLPDGKAHTLREVGRRIGVTRERVRQLEAQALRRLRHPSVHFKLSRDIK